MAGAGSADDLGSESERDVEALAEMLYTRSGHHVTRPAAPKPAATTGLQQLATSARDAWREDGSRSDSPARAAAAPSRDSNAGAVKPSNPYAALGDLDLDELLGSLSRESERDTRPVAKTTGNGASTFDLKEFQKRNGIGGDRRPVGKNTEAPSRAAESVTGSVGTQSKGGNAQGLEAHATSAPMSAPEDRQLLAKASEIADNLQGRFHELERREQKLTELLSGFEQEQRRFRLMQQQVQDESVGREHQLQEREQELAARLQQGQRLLQEVQRREGELDATRQELDAERTRLQQQLDQELDVERSTIKHAKSLVDAERQDLNARLDRMREEHQEALRQARRELEVERRRLRTQLGADVDTEREALKKEREDWQRSKQEQEAILKRERDAQALALQRAEKQLADEQKRQNELFEARRRELEQQLAESRAKSDQDRRQWESQRTTAEEEIAKQRFLNVEALRQIEDERSNREQQLASSLQRLKDDHARGLQAERSAFDAELQKRREQFAVELERHRQKFQDEANQHRDRLADERRKFEEGLRVEQERIATERRHLQSEFDQRDAEWTKRRDQETEALAKERHDLERAAIAAESELAQRRAQLDDEAKQAREASMVELRSNWDTERQELRRQLAADIDAERKKLSDAQREFDARLLRDQDGLQRTKDAQESAIRQARAELIRDKQAFQEDQRRSRAAQEVELTALRGHFETGLRDQFGATQQGLEQRQADLDRQRAEHQQQIETTQARIAEEHQKLLAAREALVTEHQHNVDELAEWQCKLESEAHQQTVLGQQWQHKVVKTEEQLRLRRSQLDRYRELLVEREQSLSREEQLVARWQQEFEVEQQNDRERMNAQRQTLDRQHQELLEEQQSAQARLAREMEKLQDRNTRLENLRKELDQTSLRNLEDRLAAEEALAELIDRTGEVEGRQRVEEVRLVIAGQIREMHHSARTSAADDTARMVALTQQQLEEEAARLKRDRETFLRRMSEREQELHDQESQLELKQREWQQRESQWRNTRDSWLKDRLEAEQIIRGLLDELAVSVEQ